LIKFNSENLVFKKIFHVSNYLCNKKIEVYKNIIYLVMLNGTIIIYNIKTNEIFYLNTDLDSANSICNIRNNIIIMGTRRGLYIYKYNIVDKKIDIINKYHKFKNFNIADIYFFKNNIIFSDFHNVYISNLVNNNRPSNIYKLDSFHDPIFLYGDNLYIFNSKKCSISIININNLQDIKTILLSFKNFDDFALIIYNIFVDETSIYINYENNIIVFDHDGELIRIIKINGSLINASFNIDSDKIYLTRNSKDSVHFLIYQQQKFKYKNKYLYKDLIKSICSYLIDFNNKF